MCAYAEPGLTPGQLKIRRELDAALGSKLNDGQVDHLARLEVNVRERGWWARWVADDYGSSNRVARLPGTQTHILEGFNHKRATVRLARVVSYVLETSREKTLTPSEFALLVNVACRALRPKVEQINRPFDVFQALKTSGWSDTAEAVQEVLRRDLLRSIAGPVQASAEDSVTSLVSDAMRSMRKQGVIAALEFVSSVCPPASQREPRFSRSCDRLAFGLVRSSGRLSATVAILDPMSKSFKIRPLASKAMDGALAGGRTGGRPSAKAMAGDAGGGGVGSSLVGGATAGGPGHEEGGDGDVSEPSIAKEFLSVLAHKERGATILLTGTSGIGKSKLGLAPADTEGAKHVVLRILFAVGGYSLKRVWNCFEKEVEKHCSPTERYGSDSNDIATALLDFTIAMFLELADAVCEVFLEPHKVEIPPDAKDRELHAACLEQVRAMDSATRLRRMKQAVFLSDSDSTDSVMCSFLRSICDVVFASTPKHMQETLRALSRTAHFGGRARALRRRTMCDVVLFFDEATAIRGRLKHVFSRVTPVVGRRRSSRATDWFYGLLVLCDFYAATFPFCTPVVTGSHFTMIEDGVSQWSPLQAGGSTTLVLSQPVDSATDVPSTTVSGTLLPTGAHGHAHDGTRPLSSRKAVGFLRLSEKGGSRPRSTTAVSDVVRLKAKRSSELTPPGMRGTLSKSPERGETRRLPLTPAARTRSAAGSISTAREDARGGAQPSPSTVRSPSTEDLPEARRGRMGVRVSLTGSAKRPAWR